MRLCPPLLDPSKTSITTNLHVLAHHGNHEIEKTDGLDESETENGVGEELTSHAWVAGNTLEESSENETDTDTGTTETDGSGTHTQVLGDLDHGVGDLRGVWAAAGHNAAGGCVEDVRGLLTLHGLESGLGAETLAGAWQGQLMSLGMPLSGRGKIIHLRRHAGKQRCCEPLGGQPWRRLMPSCWRA